MRKIVTIACTALVLSLVACSNKGTPEDNNTKKVEQNQSMNEIKEEDSIQIPSPFVECETMEEAKKLVEFELIVPDNILDGYKQSKIYVIENEMVEVILEKDENEILLRKAKGSNDISGDYNVYNENNTITVGDLQVSTRGNDGKINVATWSNKEFSYSISFNEDGVDDTIIRNMISNIN